MAKNLRAKIPASDTLIIHDRNTEATTNFVQEIGIAASSAGAESKGLGIEVASSPRVVAEKSVSAFYFATFANCFSSMMRHFPTPNDLSWELALCSSSYD